MRAAMERFAVFGLFFLLWISPTVVICDDELNGFITDIISTFKLLSPTIVYHSDAPEICLTHHWVLCLNLENEQDMPVNKKGILGIQTAEIHTC